MANVNDIRGMADEPRKEREKIDAAHAAGKIDDADYDALVSATDHYRGRGWREPTTQRTRMKDLRLSAVRTEDPLTEYRTIDDANALLRTHADAGAAAPKSQEAYTAALGAFFEFLHDHPDWPEYPFHDRIEPIETEKPGTKRKDPADMLDWEEVHDIRQTTKNPRDAAYVMFMGDTGLRVVAALSLRVRDLHLDTEQPTYSPNPDALGQKGLLDHEMGEFPIWDSARWLRRWVNEFHPDPHPDAPVFCKIHGYNPDDRENMAMKPRSLQERVDQAADAAGIEKPSNHHAFRHACVKNLRLNHDYTWEEIGNTVAWSDASLANMMQQYGKLDGDERREQILKRRGVEVSGEGDEPEPFDCWNCGSELRPTASYCPDCGVSQNRKARETRERVDDELYESKGKAVGEEGDAVDKLRELLREHPELYEQVEE